MWSELTKWKAVGSDSDPLAVLERKLTNVSNLVAAGGYQTDSALGRAAETNKDLVYSPIPRFDKARSSNCIERRSNAVLFSQSDSLSLSGWPISFLKKEPSTIDTEPLSRSQMSWLAYHVAWYDQFRGSLSYNKQFLLNFL